MHVLDSLNIIIIRRQHLAMAQHDRDMMHPCVILGMCICGCTSTKSNCLSSENTAVTVVMVMCKLP